MSLTAESPVVERWNVAVGQLDVATALLVRDLPTASARRAMELADRAERARLEFSRAFGELRAAL